MNASEHLVNWAANQLIHFRDLLHYIKLAFLAKLFTDTRYFLQTSTCTGDMENDDNHRQHLGDFQKLPTEIRLEIYKYLTPEDFQQEYEFTPSGLAFWGQSSHNPPILETCKGLRAEMLAGTFDSVRTVTIDLERITTNFITSQGILAPDEIGLCHLLEITIVRPSPRMAVDFARLRSNVHTFVAILNKSSCKILPRLAVRLDSDGGFCCGYSDFALLMGPFSKLTKPCRAVMMYRSRSFGFSPGIERQCNLLEAALSGISGNSEAEKDKDILAYQQFMLDIKVPLALRAALTDTEITPEESKELYTKLAPRVFEACLGLREWYGAKNKNPPTWLTVLCDGDTGSAPAHLAALQDRSKMAELDYDRATLWRVVGFLNRDAVKWWTAGHYKYSNPFWNDWDETDVEQ